MNVKKNSYNSFTWTFMAFKSPNIWAKRFITERDVKMEKGGK